jgi:RimJ/RimL family protein N-acetyltransferase
MERNGMVASFIKWICGALKRCYNDVTFITRNLYVSLFLKNIPQVSFDENNIICGASRKELKEALDIYYVFNNNNRINISKYIVYLLASKKMVFIVKDMFMNKIVGIDLYYFNRQDIKENTIHEAFKGVLPAWQGKGIGVSITAHAINHFKNSRIDGISTRISLNNPASLQADMKLGFRPIEEYFDKDTYENRYYLICPFGKHDHWKYLN